MLNKFEQKIQDYQKKMQNILNLLEKSIINSLPVFFITLCFTFSIFWAFIFTGISIIVNFFRIKKQNGSHEISSRFFAGVFTPLEYNLLITFYVLGAMSKAKGKVTQSDIQYAEALMSEFKVNQESRDILINVFNQGKRNFFPLDAVMIEFCRIFSNSQARDYFFSYQLNAAMQDGEIHVEELNILRIIAQAMGMNQFIFEQKIRSIQASFHAKQKFYSYFYGTEQEWSQRQDQGAGYGSYQGYENTQYRNSSSQSELKNAYDILGVKETDNIEIVKKAYRKLIKQYHPDKYISQNVPNVILEKVKEKSQEVISAYALICKTKGWK